MGTAATGRNGGRGELPTEAGLRATAELLGVHYMTAYRYVRTGRLPARKVRGEWRIHSDDLAALVQRDPDPPPQVRRSRHRERLEQVLLAGDETAAWAVVEEAMVAGADPGEVVAGLIAPSMRSIGDRWAGGEIGVCAEHRATAVAMRLLARLGPRFRAPGRKSGTVVVGAVSGDHHSLPVSLFADLLRGRGFEVVDLGADTPREAFSATAESGSGVVAVCCTASVASAVDEARSTAAALRAAHPDLIVLVGGGAVPDGEGVVGGAEEVAALLRSRPGRGRAPAPPGPAADGSGAQAGGIG